MLESPTLTTPRFTLRPPLEADVDTFWPAFSSDNHMRYWSCAAFTDREVLRDYLLHTKAGRSWVAVPHAGGAPVFRLFVGERGEQVAEIGYIMVPGHEGQGIARECLSALITHLFRQEGYQRIWGDVDPRNTPSSRLLLSLGFTREAHIRQAMKTHIGWCDTWLWGLLADEWPD